MGLFKRKEFFIMARGRQIKTIENEFIGISLAEAADEFYIHNDAMGLADASKKAYMVKVNKFVKFIGGGVDVSEMTEFACERYLIKLKASGIKMTTIGSYMRHLRAFVRYCEKRRYIAEMNFPMPKVEEVIKEPYTDEEMEKLLDKPARGNWVAFRNWVMINYFFSTGQRLSTVLNIKIKDLDLVNHTVKLTHNKDKIQKFMPLSKKMVEILEEYIYISDLRMSDWLFPEYEGKKLTIRGAQDSIAQYNKRRGVEKTSIHAFRHTFAKNYIMNGGNPAKLQKLLNHKSIDMTMRYVNLYGGDIGADIDKFNPLDNFNPNKRKRVAI